MPFYIKRGDTLPAFSATVTTDDVAVDLTGCTARLVYWDSAGTVYSRTLTVSAPATAGIVTYAWLEADTATAGTYRAEIEVTNGAGGIQTFPQRSQFQIVITEDVR